MTRLPKIVQAQLQRMGVNPAETHPDADLLTAYAEQSVGAAERENVMRHLAGCEGCREVVALALPEIESANEARMIPAGRQWFSWPVLRWGVVAAGIILVGAVGVLQFKPRPKQDAALLSTEREDKLAESTATSKAGKKAASQAFDVQASAAIETPAAPKPKTTVALQSRNAAPAAVPANEPVAAVKAISPQPQSRRDAPSGGGMAGGIFAGIRNGSGGGQAAKNNPAEGRDLTLSADAKEAASKAAPQSSTAQNFSAQASRSAAIPPSSEMVEVQSEASQIVLQNQGQDKLAKNETELPAQRQPLNNLDVVKAKDSPPPQADSRVVFAPMVSSAGASVQTLGAPRWAISASGALQRSFDAGQTWEQVNVSEVTLGARLAADSAASYEAKVQEKKVKRKNQKAESNAGVVFRALAAMGSDVWVGGSAAVLYHSPDSGAHWTRVFPIEASAYLTGDVTGVELADQQHARVATSTGQVWVTADRGQTWHQQQ